MLNYYFTEQVTRIRMRNRKLFPGIEEVRRSGADYIKNPNAQAANAWMRHHFEIWVADCQVKALVIL